MLKKILISIGILVLVFALLGVGPDRDVSFARRAPSPLAKEQLGPFMDHLGNWVSWHHGLKEAIAVNESRQPLPEAEQVPATNRRILLVIEPSGKPWKRYEILTEILEYVPGNRLSMKLVEDSTGRIPKFLDEVRWQVELGPQPSGKGTEVRSAIQGRTKTWRSRVYARIAEKIMMNQVLYPDIIQFAEVKPNSVAMPAAAKPAS